MIDRHFRHLPWSTVKASCWECFPFATCCQWRIDDLSQELDSLEQYVANDGPGG